MGVRLSTPRNAGAYQNLIYPKGGYVLHMLRSMMWDARNGDQAFQRMMQDFVQTHLYRAASTESFQAIVEKHATPDMRITPDGKMDWFFQEWVYGTDVPKYDFRYELAENAGKVTVRAALQQSGVSEMFRMPVPVYADFDGRTIKLGSVVLVGNTTANFEVPLPQKPRRVLINANYDVLAQK